MPAFDKPAERAIEKHPAWAAAISSSGLVPVPSSNRDEKEYWPSKAPPPRRMFPLPSFRPPSQRAFAVRAGMAGPPRLASSGRTLLPLDQGCGPASRTAALVAGAATVGEQEVHHLPLESDPDVLVEERSVDQVLGGRRHELGQQATLGGPVVLDEERQRRTGPRRLGGGRGREAGDGAVALPVVGPVVGLEPLQEVGATDRVHADLVGQPLQEKGGD